MEQSRKNDEKCSTKFFTGCNVLNWSSSNHIIAALGKITYMWHVPSSTMTKSIKCSYDITALQMNKDSTILAFAGEELSECEIKVSITCFTHFGN